MDSGSQRTYITDSLKNELGLVAEKTEVLNLNTFGNDQIQKRKCDRVRLQLRGQRKNIEIAALSFSKICAPLSTTLDIDQYPYLDGLELADDNLLNNSASPEIDILIGSDHYYDIITGEIRRGDDGPCAVNSEFGWLICGGAKTRNSKQDPTVANLVTVKTTALPYDTLVRNEHEQLTEVLDKFWNTESIGIAQESEAIPQEFLRDVKYDEAQSRYQVSLPWKEGCLIESSGYPQCVKRLEHVYSRLKSQPELLKEYDNVMRQQLETGIIEPVSKPTEFDSTHYLPHHGVIRREKLTTKVRVVFDGSAKHGDATLSINECLEKGPNLVPHLFDVLVKFRGFPIGVASAFRRRESLSPDRD
jgi:hypothetical protein